MTWQPWDPSVAGVVTLPGGRRVRGRGLRDGARHGPGHDPRRGERAGAPADAPPGPEFGLYLLGRRPPPTDWPARWVRWPDFGLPLRADDARDALRDLYNRAATQRVEVACGGGVGRTGTALACLAVLDGIPPGAAVGWVREHYRGPDAVETPWQRRFVTRFAAHLGARGSDGRNAGGDGSVVPPTGRRRNASMLTMYTTSWCPFCVRLKAGLQHDGIEYTEIDIEREPGAAQIVMKVNGGNRTVPTVVFADGTALTNPSVREVKAKLAA